MQELSEPLPDAAHAREQAPCKHASIGSSWHAGWQPACRGRPAGAMLDRLPAALPAAPLTAHM